ncbi:MAG: hypothetical protein IH944_01475 [Armatimonadetes bacterium]|nr:hypothetical protein [Armatimonadota bacterium]
MDAFSDDHPEFTGALISMEFGAGGRIHQLWASDPDLPDEGEDFQFILSPVAFGQETAEDYYPGTILIGIRSDPGDPWVLSRNSRARRPEADDEPDDDSTVEFEYEMPLIDDLKVTGRYFELPGTMPQVVWEVTLKNRSRHAVEIGELGFPLAFNNLYDGFGWNDDQLKRLWNSRVYVHKFIGGGASWLFAQRMTAETPGLLVFPGTDTSWEFYNHVRASLTTSYQWEGIPVVYVYSKATIERERGEGWHNDHTSLILEPGEERTMQMRFVPTESDQQDGVHQTLVACDRPAVRLLPGAVAPIDVGIAIEVAGASPKEFLFSRETESQIDTDESGGFCFVKPSTPGPLRVSFRDDEGRICHTHLLLTEPLGDLIRSRAEYIHRFQIIRKPGSVLDHAFANTDITTGTPVVDLADYREPGGIECSLADALYLAEKNTVYPDRDQIAALDAFIEEFLRDEVQNPGDHSVASVLSGEEPFGAYVGRPLGYPHVTNLYHSMYRIASTYGETASAPLVYLRWAAATATAMFNFGWRHYVRTVGVLGYARIYDLLDDLRLEGLTDEHSSLQELVQFKAKELMRHEYPYAGESVLDTSGFEEVFAAAKFREDDTHLERTVRCAFAVRSLAPSWWWYGSDKRCWDGNDSTPTRAMADRGELCLGHTTIPNSLIFYDLLDRDYLAIPDAYMRLAFGGMLGPWALVRPDGAASLCYCPDQSSKHWGFNRYTGASGLGYYHYLRRVGSYVLPDHAQGVFTFGCHFESDDESYVVRPWDGVGRHIVLRQFGAEFTLSFGRIVSLKLDRRKRWFELEIENPSDKDVDAKLAIVGMWGDRISVAGTETDSDGGAAIAKLRLPARHTSHFRGNVVS